MLNKGHFKDLWSRIVCFLPSLYFNIKYLPLRQALRMPILVHKPHYWKMKSKLVIDASLKYGMIRLGFLGGHMYPNNGIAFTLQGGTIVLRENAKLAIIRLLYKAHVAQLFLEMISWQVHLLRLLVLKV